MRENEGDTFGTFCVLNVCGVFKGVVQLNTKYKPLKLRILGPNMLIWELPAKSISSVSRIMK